MPIALAISALIGYLLFSSSVDTASDIVEKTIPDTFDSIFKKYGSMYGVDWKILKRIAWVESNLGLNPRVAKGIKNPNDVAGSTSSDGKSWGVMQMTLTTMKDYDITPTAQELNNPDYSIKLSTELVRDLKRIFSNERDIVMAYNQGQGNQKKFLNLEKSGTLKETQFPAARDYWRKYNIAKGLI